jgi:hypothetical protein
LSRAIALAALLVAGCYDPNPQDGAFRCSVDAGSVCPDGLTCEASTGLCVRFHPHDDMGGLALGPRFDLSGGLGPNSCDDRVRVAGFSNLTNLAEANTADDETAIALTLDGKRLYFLSAGKLTTVEVNGKSATNRADVTLNNAPATLYGGSFASDGNYWLAGNSGNGGAQLVPAKVTSATVLDVSATAHQPMTLCPFTGPAFVDGDATKELYVSYPLAGCGMAPMIAVGTVDKNMGAFVGVVAATNLRAPSLVPGGLTLIASSGDTHPRLFFAERPSKDVQWSGPTPLPLGTIGLPSGGDVQAVVDATCSTLYLVADRAGGKGGTDLWAADIGFHD